MGTAEDAVRTPTPRSLLGVQRPKEFSTMSGTNRIRPHAHRSGALLVIGALIATAVIVSWVRSSSAADALGQPPPEWAANAGSWPAHNYNLSNTRATTQSPINSQ